MDKKNNQLNIFETDYDGKILCVAPTSSELMYKLPEGVIGKTLHDIFPKAEADKFLEVIRKCLDENRTITIEYPLIIKGETMWFEGKASPKSSKIAFFITQDITELRKEYEALKESEDRLSKIMLASNDGMWDWNLKTNEVYYDPRYYKMAGYSVNEFPHTLEEFQKRIHPEYLDMVMNQAQKHLNGEIDRFIVEFPFKKKNGEWMWILGRGVIVERDENGVPLRFVGTHTDITERKKISEALRLSEEKFRLAFKSSPDALNINTMDGVYVDINEGFTNVTGYTRKDVIGKSSLEINIWVKHKDHKKLVTALKKKGFVQNLESQFRCKDGSIKIGLMSAAIITINDKPHILSITRDITEIKKAEESLKQSEEKYRLIFEESQDVIFVSSTDGRILDMNPAGLKLFGYSSLEEIKNVDISKELYKNPEEWLKYQEFIQKNGFVKDYELHLKKKDGSELIVLENSTAIYDTNKNIIGYRGILRDITEKKKLEAQLLQAQKMEAVGNLAGGIAHDFNNLLTVINGYAEMALRSMKADNPLYKNIMYILEAGKRAKNLTSQLLAFSRKQIYKPEILNINKVISSMDKMLRRLIDEDINIETILAKSLPNIKADKSQLEQIFINLVVNARDALRAVKKKDFQKKITIETGQTTIDKEYVLKHPGSKEGQYIFFAVSDNGIGMDEETKSKIFEPFFTTKGKEKGTGLGLSMVYGIVKQNNGFIYVYSEPGEGTMFKIYWPVTEEKGTLKKAKVEDTILRGNETILIVEDEEDVRRFASEALTYFGYNVIMAANGRIALELIKKESLKFDLIITDIVMPELNGKDFIKKVRKFYPDVKVLYVSGYTENHIVHNGILEENVNFINKPYSVEVLASTVRKILDEN